MPVIDKKDNRWAYFEVRETKTKYGKKNIYVNDYIEIYFDKYGIVKKFEFFNLNNMNDIKFAKEKTRSLGVKRYIYQKSFKFYAKTNGKCT